MSKNLPVMTEKWCSLNKVQVPTGTLPLLNAGGFEWGSMGEFYGANGAGKTSFCASTVQLNLEHYGDQIIVLWIDVENSFNPFRMRKVFGISPCNTNSGIEPDNRVFLERTSTIEDTCELIAKYVKKAEESKKFLLILWDSIGVTTTRTNLENFNEAVEKDKEYNAFAGNGMMGKPRIIREQLNQLMHQIGYKPVFLMIINQATTSVGRFVSTVDSAGGYGLKQNIAYRLKFTKVTKVQTDDGLPIATVSTIDCNKNKFMPENKNLEIKIDDTVGGVIDSRYDLVQSCVNLKYICTPKQGWRNFTTEIIDKYKNDPRFSMIFEGNYRERELYLDDNVVALCREVMKDYYCKHYMLLKDYYEFQEEIMQTHGEKEKAPKKKDKTENLSIEEN